MWKERWFYDGGVIPPGTESDYEDLNLGPLKLLQVFLQEYADEGTIFTEPEASKEDEEFNSFSNSFKELYVKAYPKDKSVYRGKGRDMKHDALDNHMRVVEGPIEYSFQSVKDKNGNDIKRQYQVIAAPRQDKTNT